MPAPTAASVSASVASSTAASTPWAVAALVAVNLIPVAGVAFFGWSTYDLMLLYWFENGVIGVYTALAMLLTRGPEGTAGGLGSLFGKLFLIAFFAVHYGLFWSAHGFFVVSLFAPGGAFAGDSSTFLTGASMDGPLGFFAVGSGVVARYLSGGLLLTAVGMALSHGISFVGNVLQRGEGLRTSPNELMARPYGRVFVLHVTLVVGAFLIVALGEPVAALLLFVGLKTAVDLGAHLRAHRPR